MDGEQTRRAFFRNAIVFGLPVALGSGTWLADKFGGALIQRIVDISIPEPRDLPNAIVMSSKNLFFGNGANYKVIPALDNPYKLWGFKAPITSATADALADLNKLLSVPDVRVTRTDRLTSNNVAGNLLVLGSPVANKIALEIMGRGGSSPLFDSQKDENELRFPFYVDIDASEREYSTGAYRFRDNFSRAPIWQLKGRGRTALAPTLRNGQPIEDRILITSIPNILDMNSFEAGHRINIFAGAHGAGTRAIGLLIRSEKIIQDLLSFSAGRNAWQAIVVVDHVSDDGRMPISLGGIEDAISIGANFEYLCRAASKSNA